MKNLLLSISIFAITFTVFAQKTSKTMDFDGQTREYIEYIPGIYTSNDTVPLVICLHGLGDNMDNFFGIGMNHIADTANFIVLTPEALVDGLTSSTAWNSGASAYGIVLNGNVDDVGFISALIDTTMSLYNIDTSRVYVTGLSMGGFMTQRLACQLNERFAAVASVAGTFGTAMTCTNDNPIPVCHFHGTHDSTIYYTNNMYGNDPEELVNFWVQKNNCDTISDTLFMPDNAADGRTVQKITYPNESTGNEVVFYKVINGLHEWLFTPTNDISYTKEIWKFFLKHQKQTVSSVNDINNDISFNIYPNPAKNNVQIIIKNNGLAYNIEIININGLIVKQFKTTNKQINIDLSFATKGIYFVRIIGKNSVTTQKLIIE